MVVLSKRGPHVSQGNPGIFDAITAQILQTRIITHQTAPSPISVIYDVILPDLEAKSNAAGREGKFNDGVPSDLVGLVETL
jgi:hypothetical protein